ncbi:uncharacterized protein K441DRAFT_663648 [Cenococcum geophilum 1.58]|uniref:uncharacterized protein n=1 Tax=Cenococcum geophilum 1.58 TaxID=794803 RepID=UPI00358FA9FD|nr:hypothetical protein K441DRAFT_663648 [Cenococcum geophilum 1.58]
MPRNTVVGKAAIGPVNISDEETINVLTPYVMPKPNPLDHTNHQKGSSSVSRLDGLPVGMPYKLSSPYHRYG